MHRLTLHETEEYRITTASLEKKLGIRTISAVIDDRRMRWAGHVARMDENRLPRKFLTSWVRAKRRTGRPYLSTAHSIKDVIQRAGVDTEDWIVAASDRAAWADLSSAVMPKLKRKRCSGKIEIGADGAQERCFNCKKGSHGIGPLVMCDRKGCTAVWHERCLGAGVKAALLPDIWFCPLCKKHEKNS